MFSYGYRNPWRLYHDPELGLLVGEAMWKDKFQQVTVAEEGGNFGYPEVSRETKKCWEGDQLSEYCQQTPAGDPIVPPVLEYSPNIGSIISGVVPVHGGSIPELDGSVLVSDWDGALIAATPGEAPWPHREVEIDSFEPPLYDTLWDLDHADGAIYLMYAEPDMQGGSIHRLTGP
ncbi:MAG: PQQ-dependent sugar dehydrogenase [Propionibacteriaceae bacterium]